MKRAIYKKEGRVCFRYPSPRCVLSQSKKYLQEVFSGAVSNADQSLPIEELAIIGNAAANAIPIEDVENEALKRMYDRGVPTGLKYWLVEPEDIPQKEDYRSTWEFDDSLPHDGVGT